MLQVREEPFPQVLKMLRVGLANLPQQQAFQARDTLTIIHAHLCKQPMRLATTPRSPIANCRWPIWAIAAPGCRRRCKLSRLQENLSGNKIPNLLLGATRQDGLP